MLNFIGVCGFESTVKKEMKKYDACVREYNGKVISVRCIQSTENKRGGWVAWIWTQDGDKLVGDYKMCGIAHLASDLPIVISETKKFIDELFPLYDLGGYETEGEALLSAFNHCLQL